jgi:hypothetical protein
MLSTCPSLERPLDWHAIPPLSSRWRVGAAGPSCADRPIHDWCRAFRRRVCGSVGTPLPGGQERWPFDPAPQLLEPRRDHVVRVVEHRVGLGMRHEHEMVGLVRDAPGAVLVKDPVEALHQAADVARLHGEVERILDPDANLARDRRRRERTGQLHSAQRGLARPEESRASLGGPGPAQGVPVPVAIGIPEHAVVGDLHDQAGGAAVVEDANLGRIGDGLRREYGRRARREPKGHGDGEGAAWAAPVRAHRKVSLEGISHGARLIGAVTTSGRSLRSWGP